MKAFKRFTALVLALVMAAMLAVSAYAATVVVKYKVYVYTSQLTFKQYDYSSSTTPSTRNLTILADSSLGSGSALYHLKYVNGTVAYCIQVCAGLQRLLVQPARLGAERHRAGSGLRLPQCRVWHSLWRQQQRRHRERRKMGRYTGDYLGLDL